MNRFYSTVVAVGLFTYAMLASPVADARNEDPSRFDFNVFLNDKKIGTHSFELQSENGIREVKSVANFKYTVFFIPAYRYEHSNNERWQDNCLIEFAASTNANGKKSEVSGSKVDESFQIDNGATPSELPECIMSFAYWNPDFLSQRRLLNQQTGEYVDVEVQEIGSESLEVRGEAVTATRFQLTSPNARLTLWYSTEDEWLALESIAKNGQIIRYELS